MASKRGSNASMIDRARERECLNVFIYLQMLVVKILILLAGKFNLLYFFSFLFPGRVLNAFMHHITVPTQCYDHMQILQKFKKECVRVFFFLCSHFVWGHIWGGERKRGHVLGGNSRGGVCSLCHGRMEKGLIKKLINEINCCISLTPTKERTT